MPASCLCKATQTAGICYDEHRGRNMCQLFALLADAKSWHMLRSLCYAMLCYVYLCYVMICYVKICYVMLCYGMLWYVMSWYVMLWCVMLCYAMLWYVMLCDAMQCYVILCYGMLCLLLYVSTLETEHQKILALLCLTYYRTNKQSTSSQFQCYLSIGNIASANFSHFGVSILET